MSELIIDTIKALKSRLDQNNMLLVQKEEGFLEKQQFLFNPPALENEINELPFVLPDDYKEFLKLYNGITLYLSPEYGDCFKIFSISEILDDYQYIDYPEGWFPIGYGYDGSRLIIAPVSGTKGYIYWLDDGSDLEDPNGHLGLTFEEWLDYFIVAQGCKFWEWLIKLDV